MKKLKTQTGLVRGKPGGETARKKTGGASNKKAAKQRKTAKLKDKKEAKTKHKQGGKGRPFRAKPWADYAKGESPQRHTQPMNCAVSLTAPQRRQIIV